MNKVIENCPIEHTCEIDRIEKIDPIFDSLKSIESIDAAIRPQTHSHLNSVETGCFLIKSANEWLIEAKERAIPNMLFGELWHEGEQNA